MTTTSLLTQLSLTAASPAALADFLPRARQVPDIVFETYLGDMTDAEYIDEFMAAPGGLGWLIADADGDVVGLIRVYRAPDYVLAAAGLPTDAYACEGEFILLPHARGRNFAQLVDEAIRSAAKQVPEVEYLLGNTYAHNRSCQRVTASVGGQHAGRYDYRPVDADDAIDTVVMVVPLEPFRA